MQLSKVIEQLGYRPNEARTYLAALAIGECTVADIAIKARLPHSSVQVAVNKLHKDGLMNFYIHKRYKHWVAQSPEKLLQVFKEKEATLAVAMKKLSTLTPKRKCEPNVKVYVCADEIRLIHESMIRAKHRIDAIIPWETWIATLGQEYVDDFIALRVRHFLNIRMLTPKTRATTELKSRDNSEFRHVKFLPEDVNIEDAIFIFGDNVAIIALNESCPTSVVIDDPATGRTMRTFFEHFWEHGREQ